MQRLVQLGIHKEGFSNYSCPVMLIAHKNPNLKHIITDLHYLNGRVYKLKLAYPLLKDSYAVLDSSKCETLPVIDLKDAYYSIHLRESSPKLCGILPYSGSASYLDQTIPKGLNTGSVICNHTKNAILESLQNRNHFLAIIDDFYIYTRR